MGNKIKIIGIYDTPIKWKENRGNFLDEFLLLYKFICIDTKIHTFNRIKIKRLAHFLYKGKPNKSKNYVEIPLECRANEEAFYWNSINPLHLLVNWGQFDWNVRHRYIPMWPLLPPLCNIVNKSTSPHCIPLLCVDHVKIISAHCIYVCAFELIDSVYDKYLTNSKKFAACLSWNDDIDSYAIRHYATNFYLLRKCNELMTLIEQQNKRNFDFVYFTHEIDTIV